MGTSRGYFMDLQGFGNAQGHLNGSLWVYGNLFRYDPAATQKMSRFWQGFCDIQSSGYKYYLFNNTFDMDSPMERICGTAGDLVVERNNAFLGMTALYASTATFTRRSNNEESSASSDRGEWFNAGAFSSGSPAVHGGLANYRPRAGGPLDGSGDCDPDDDDVPGVDWNGDGTAELQWVDLAGNAVNCSAGGATLTVGAIQKASAAPVCGSGLSVGEACDDANPCTIADVCTAAAVCVGIPVLAPSEVDNGVRVSRSGSAAVVSWNPSPNATTFDLLRGTISALPVGPGAGDETCLGNSVAVPAYTDAAVPPANSGYWYLIRGTNVCAGNGPFGFAGVRGAPGTSRTSTTCP